MNKREFTHIVITIIILSIISAIGPSLKQGIQVAPQIIGYSIILVGVAVISKKIAAHLLDANVEHELWTVQRFGLKKHQYLKNGISAGVIFPLFLSLFSLGFIKLPTLLTFETRAATHRAAKRFGFYSYASMTDWHNALIVALSILSLWILAFLAYLAGQEYLVQMTAWYTIASMIPLSKLDGTQLFFGSRVLYTLCLLGTIVLLIYALLLAGKF